MSEEAGFEVPAACADGVRETHFGVTLEDRFRWLEDVGSERVRRWLAGQAQRARSVLEALPQRAEIRAGLAQAAGGAVVRSQVRVAGDAVFCLQQEPGREVAALTVRGWSGGGERVVLDPARLGGAGHATIDWYVPSPDGRRVACAVSRGGSGRGLLHVVEVGSGGVREALVEGVVFAFVAWLADAGGEFDSFVYHCFPDVPDGTPPDRARLNSRSLLHRLGEDPSRDRVVLARDINPRLPLTEEDRPFLVLSPGGRWALALVSHSSLGLHTSEELSDCTLYVAPASGLAHPAGCRWRRVAGVEDEVVAYALGADTLYLVLGRDSPRYQVVAVRLTEHGPQQPQLLVPGSDRVVEAITLAGDYLLVRDLDGGISRLRRVRVDDGQVVEVALPVQGSVEEWAADPEQTQVLLQLSSWTLPPRTYRCDVRTAAVIEAGWDPVPTVELAELEAHELQVPARDGTAIPLSLVHRAGLRRDGENPTLITAYGSHGYALRPSFEPELLPWYQHGGVLAVAHVRGGGEHGRDWHASGQGIRKETAISDLIDCAEYLIANGYTRPARLAAEGASAGGITVGGAMVRRPDLFAAVVLRVPVTNAVRNEVGANGPINVPELGSVTTEEGFKALLIMDCYHRVQDGTRYPAVLLTGGINDPRVDIWQPAKMAARLQQASTSGRPVLLRIDFEAGHGFGSTQSQRDDELADMLAFLLNQLHTAGHPPTRSADRDDCPERNAVAGPSPTPVGSNVRCGLGPGSL